ncbi:hypothetical protein T484DRAFT_1854003 [Baffinella frigidus]|nr:hypothetical protein T484DRAFT_1854003 [Cryptophyta sp. CCMP2293]
MAQMPAYKKAVDGSTALGAVQAAGYMPTVSVLTKCSAPQGAVAPSAEAKGDARIYVANAGDCRAVLCRAGRAVFLPTSVSL